MTDKIFIDHIIPNWVGYEKIYDDFSINNSECVHGNDIHNVLLCPSAFHRIMINSDGQANFCGCDWKRNIVIGNASSESLLQIWNSEEKYEFLTGMLRNGRIKNHPACAKCMVPIYDTIDNIDKYADVILRNFEKKHKHQSR